MGHFRYPAAREGEGIPGKICCESLSRVSECVGSLVLQRLNYEILLKERYGFVFS